MLDDVGNLATLVNAVDQPIHLCFPDGREDQRGCGRRVYSTNATVGLRSSGWVFISNGWWMRCGIYDRALSVAGSQHRCPRCSVP